MLFHSITKTNSVWHDFIEYFRTDLKREVSGWAYVLRYFGILTPIIVILFAALIWYVNPFPPKKAYMATGQRGSSYEQLAHKFAEYFAQAGYELELVETDGLPSGLKRLQDDNSPVNAAFLTGGAAKASDFPNLGSLGSVQFSPLWIFYRGAERTGAQAILQLSEGKTAVGAVNTSTNNIVRQILNLHGLAYKLDNPNTFEVSHQEAALMLEKGEIDTMFIVDSLDSPIIQRLIKLKDIRIQRIGLIDAYTKNIQYLEKLIVPMGSLNIENMLPPQDTELLSTTVTLLIEKNTHPAHQWLFLMAARSISHDRNQFFSKAGFFPAYLDQNIPLTTIAKKYYSEGVPSVFEYLPLWIATLFDRVWVILIALFAVVYPAYNAVVNWRTYPGDKVLGDYYKDLRAIDNMLDATTSKEELQSYINELNEIEADLKKRWFDSDQLSSYFSFRTGLIEDVRTLVYARMKKLEVAPVKQE